MGGDNIVGVCTDGVQLFQKIMLSSNMRIIKLLKKIAAFGGKLHLREKKLMEIAIRTVSHNCINSQYLI